MPIARGKRLPIMSFMKPRRTHGLPHHAATGGICVERTRAIVV
jgi:hypothetical protein